MFIEKNMYCGILKKVEFIYKLSMENNKVKENIQKYLKIGMKQLYGHVCRG